MLCRQLARGAARSLPGDLASGWPRRSYPGCPISPASSRPPGNTVTSMPGVTSLPSDISPYGQIWHYGIEDSPSAADEQTLESFVRSGGSLFLTCEWGDSTNWDNQADQDLINALVPTGSISMPGDDDPGIALPVNPTVIDNAGQAPNALTTWTGSAVGGMTGVPAAGSQRLRQRLQRRCGRSALGQPRLRQGKTSDPDGHQLGSDVVHGSHHDASGDAGPARFPQQLAFTHRGASWGRRSSRSRWRGSARSRVTAPWCTLCVPKTSSTSCDQAIFVNQATEASLFRTRCWSRLTGSGSGFSGAAACRKRCGRS